MLLASPEHEAFSVFRMSFSVSFEPISVLIASSDPLDRRICFCVTAAPSNKFCVPNRKTVRRRITHRDTVCRARMLETLTWCVALLWRQHLHARGMFVFFYDTLSLSHSLSVIPHEPTYTTIVVDDNDVGLRWCVYKKHTLTPASSTADKIIVF